MTRHTQRRRAPRWPGLSAAVAGVIAAGSLLNGSVAAELNLATLRCDTYETQILNAPPAAETEDALNLVMWLYGYAVAKSGAHAIYTDGLQPFGNALDAECKARPASTLLAAVETLRPTSANSVDFGTLKCGTFERNHTDLEHKDPESAKTIMMWLVGFAAGRTGGHSVDSAALSGFAAALSAECAKHADGKLYDALLTVKAPRPRK